MSRVVFIPKPGKFSYSTPKDFRPLSLTSFLLKGLEKLVLWYAEEKFLSPILHPNLFAYRQKKSTENTLHAVVHNLEKIKTRKKCGVLVCLDIDSAFSMATPESMVGELARAGCDGLVCLWVWKLLTDRQITSNWGGAIATRQVNRGAPQGGILSPVLFNLIMNTIFTLHNNKSHINFYVYADDLAMLIEAEDYRSAVHITNFELRKLANWARGHSLTFSPSKTNALLFYKKIPPLELPLLLNGEKIQWETEVKYLGVIIDNKLKWKSHLQYVHNKCQATMFQMSKIVGATWGTSPKVMYLIYNCIVKPALLYGAVAWIKCLNKVTYLRKLQKIQSQACRLILGVQRSTPVAAMEVILNLRPLELEAETKAILAAGRLRRFQDWRLEEGDTALTTARFLENKINDRYNTIDLPTTNGKKSMIYTFFEYKIDPEMRSQHLEVTPPDHDHVHVYTDGSKDDQKQVGFGYTIKTKTKSLTHEAHFNLGTMPSVFQAEVMAVKTAAEWILNQDPNGKTFDFYIDNQAAIYALKKVTITDGLIKETKRALNLLSNNNLVRLNWIPGHSGFRGNEIADRKAKLGTQTVTDLCEPALPVMDNFYRSEVDRLAREAHNDMWYNTFPKYRQTRLFFHELRPRETRWLLEQSRDKVHSITGMITGHNSLNYHQFNIGNTDSALCRFCEEADESAAHLLCNCPAITSQVLPRLGFHPPRRIDLETTRFSRIYQVWNFILNKIN